jgi:hypothetical protein
MNRDEIVKMIMKKIDEHFTSMEEVNLELKTMKKEKTIESAAKHMILKDKAVFHKACVLVLNDVLKEIK